MERPVPPAFDAQAFLAAAAPAAGLDVPPECREGVAANLQRAWGFASLLLDFAPLEGIEPATTFDPFGEAP